MTEMLRDRPLWEGEAPDPSRERTTKLPRRRRGAARRKLPDDSRKTQRLWDDDDPPKG